MKPDHLYQHSNSHDVETTVSKCPVHEDQHTELLMQFGNRGRISSARPFERQHQELPSKNNSFLPPVITNICNCTKRPINGITIQLKRNAWDSNPRWCKTVPFTLDVCETTQHHIKKTQTQPDFDAAAMLLTAPQRLYLWATAQTDWDIHTSGEDARFAQSASPFAGQGCSASLCSKAPPLSTHARTNPHGLADLPETTPAAVVHHNSTASAAIDSVFSPCSVRRWPCVLCQTLHPLRHDARSEGEHHGTGARPRGWPSGFLLNGGQNQAAKKRERGNISLQVHMSFVVVVIDDALVEHFLKKIYFFIAFQNH